MSDRQPSVRPLGAIALGTAILSFGLSLTYFLSPHAIAVAVLATAVGGVARTDPETSEMGFAAILLSVAAVAVSAALIVII